MQTKKKPAFELADVFAMHGLEYRLTHKLPAQHLNTMFAIENCRKPILGGHIHKCDSCGHEVITHNSCRNRHCPKCQTLDRIKWADKLSSNLLPMRHFHIVFTIPSELNRLALVNQKTVYNILFKAASQSLLSLAKDPKHLGANTGMIAVLHTWGQNLMDHPHLHTIVPGGGWSEWNQYWKNSKRKFFIPERVLSKLFKGKFLAFLKEAKQKGTLKFEGEIAHLKSNQKFKEFLNLLYDKNKKWVIHTNPTFKNSKQIVEYLARYTHRVAISNERIVELTQDSVSFQWKDYKDGSKQKLMKLSPEEFIRRFLLHVLPIGFCKIRYYGLYAHRNSKGTLMQCKKAMGIKPLTPKLSDKPWQEILHTLSGIDVMICPHCKKGNMTLHSQFRGGKQPAPS